MKNTYMIVMLLFVLKLNILNMRCTLIDKPPEIPPDPELEGPSEYYGEIIIKGGSEELWAIIHDDLHWLEYNQNFKPSNWDNVWFSWRELIPYTEVQGSYVVKYDEVGNQQTYAENNAWIWQPDNMINHLEGTMRYSFSADADGVIEVKPGIDLFRLSYKGNNDIGYFNGVVDIASTYLEVPYVYGWQNNEYDQEVHKSVNQGYDGLECSGLVSWSYLENNYDVNPYYGTNEDKVTYTDSNKLDERFGVMYSCNNRGTFCDWPDDYIPVESGDIWMIGDCTNDECTEWDITHVGIIYNPTNEVVDCRIFHASFSNRKVVKSQFTTWWEENAKDIGKPIVAGYY